jgi:hypothetical protein
MSDEHSKCRRAIAMIASLAERRDAYIEDAARLPLSDDLQRKLLTVVDQLEDLAIAAEFCEQCSPRAERLLLLDPTRE